MRRVVGAVALAVVLSAGSIGALGDPFGTGANRFWIDFATIAGALGVTRSTNTSGDAVATLTAGLGYSDFVARGGDYRIGKFEITNEQWDKFKAELGVPVIGSPFIAYDEDPLWTGPSIPTNEISWYEAAQFVNWLNTSTGHPPAYKFTGTQGEPRYWLDKWSPDEADNGTNLYRHKDAFYYLPTEDEWLQAAYWNGTDLQTWSTLDDTAPVQNVHANYANGGVAPPWKVGNGLPELNGTFDMMGNVAEWLESPESDTSYAVAGVRGARGGTMRSVVASLASSQRGGTGPSLESGDLGFRVAADVPEPGTLALLTLAGLVFIRRGRALA
jgi:hypothetical protein